LYQSHTWPVAPVGVTTSGHVTPGTVAKPAGAVGVTGVVVENRKCQMMQQVAVDDPRRGRVRRVDGGRLRDRR
jgi:hypothetical protein